MKKERTYGVSNQLIFPQRFHQLRTDQKDDAISYLAYLETVIQQAVLENWDTRCRSGGIISEAGYLFRLIELARKKKFRFTLPNQKPQNSSRGASLQPPVAPSKDQPYIPASPETRNRHIRTIYSILGKKPPAERYKEENKS
ncbi:hypothetical protein CUZ56_02349 [Saezia sanguinis]|uniref:Uncharacterized protein n=1 Tax=Saezia sanguinis TaxID=1965230 RepID=A0A433SB83_9BURK|nr:hypothetical protein [Saezia sanguinis]RUS65993.1 hypothetical protein CUZ56_02349 [Saezia sanguinis]